jgi:periplasmic divalent cation tolerance protein
VVVLVTCPDRPVAERIARALVEERLAACVNLLPGLTSIYRWEGALCQESETLLLIKTRRERLSALARRVKALHPYTVPEVIALPVLAGSTSYLKWIRDSVR